MPNPFTGLLAGTKPAGWQDCDAILKGETFAGAPATQPYNPTGTNYGRYFDTGTGFVVFQFRFAFDANTTFGSGEDVWAVKLPVTANRSSGAADLPNGACSAWQGAAASPQLMIPLRATLMDPMSTDKSGAEDDYVQFFLPYMENSGTGSIASASTSTTITHGLGVTPLAQDINVVPTATTTNNPGLWFVNTLGSTTFQVNVKTAPGSGGFNFSWKAKAEPNTSATLSLLVNHLRPFAWASGNELAGTIVYEARV